MVMNNGIDFSSILGLVVTTVVLMAWIEGTIERPINNISINDISINNANQRVKPLC